ncbi:MAG: FeoB small GTPase domain-containing protein [Halanaerobium sp.]|nr:FeoB small GTPase domain-containing protein [Halanaerobium sp.]
MGLTSNSTGIHLLRDNFKIDKHENPVIALAGNPNTGKSTIFNNLTGLRQHTGNWPGKTVTQAHGYFQHRGIEYTLIDLPGTYSLLANSTEEKIARDFICFARPEATIVVADATNLERNLNLVLQVTELTENTILCLNLMDEARRKNIIIDIAGLQEELQIPIIPTTAREGIGLEDLKDTVADIVAGRLQPKPAPLRYSQQIESALDEIIPGLEDILAGLNGQINFRWLALRFLEGDYSIIESLETHLPAAEISTEAHLQESGVQTDGLV